MKTILYMIVVILLASNYVLSQNFWEPNGLNDKSIGYITSDSSGKLYAAEQVLDYIYISEDYGETWQFLSEIDDTSEIVIITCLVFKDDLVFASSLGGSGIYKSSDLGITWVPQNNGLQSNDITKITERNDSLFASSWIGLYLSIDNGENWGKLHPETLVLDDFSLLFDDRIVALNEDDVFISYNKGISWDTILIASVHSPFRNILSEDNMIYVGSKGDGVYVSSDYGNVWNLRYPAVGYAYVDAAELTSTGIYMIGGELTGCYITYDQGESWVEANSGLPNKYINSIFIDEQCYVYTGLTNFGIYKSSSPVTSIEEDSKVKLNSYILFQNYPNPFNSTTNIKYTIPQSGKVKIVVFNLMGCEIATIQDKFQQAGSYDVIFQADNLASGIYFYEIRANKFRDVKKLLLLK
jgi:photosystem II stability/assembly factor-like uncharacterized protein